jgi:energy-converting hydrogenase Eha subunit C
MKLHIVEILLFLGLVCWITGVLNVNAAAAFYEHCATILLLILWLTNRKNWRA